MSEAAPSAPTPIDETEETPPHILVVDDDTRIRTLLKRYLMENGFRVSTSHDAAEARARLRGLAFDLIILDVMMPGEDGFALTRALREKSDVPILLLTARTETEDRIEGLERGADDYLTKPFEPRELLLRVQTILRRSRPAQAGKGEIRMGECRFDPERGQLWRNGEPVKLSTREAQLLRIFAAQPGEPISRTELCERTGNAQARTVDVQITRLRRKIEIDPKAPVYLQTVRGEGYMLVTD